MYFPQRRMERKTAEVGSDSCAGGMEQEMVERSLSDPQGVAGQVGDAFPSSRAQGRGKCHSTAKPVGDATHKRLNPPSAAQSDKIHI